MTDVLTDIDVVCFCRRPALGSLSRIRSPACNLLVWRADRSYRLSDLRSMKLAVWHRHCATPQDCGRRLCTKDHAGLLCLVSLAVVCLHRWWQACDEEVSQPVVGRRQHTDVGSFGNTLLPGFGTWTELFAPFEGRDCEAKSSRLFKPTSLGMVSSASSCRCSNSGNNTD